MSDKLIKKQKSNAHLESYSEKNAYFLPEHEGLNLNDIDSGKTFDYKVKKTLIEGAEFTNELSSKAQQVLHDIENHKEVKVSTDYIEKNENESVEKLARDLNTEAVYQRKNIFGGQKADSTEMRNIKVNLEGLFNALTTPFNADNLQLGIDYITTMYKAVIDYCNIYLSDSSKGKHTDVGLARKNMVKRIRKACMRESVLFPEAAKNAAIQTKNGDESAPKNWSEVIRQVRSEHITHNNATIEREGGGTSSLLKITSEGKTYYYKESETLKKNKYEDHVLMARESLNNMVKMGQCTKESGQKAFQWAKRLLDAIEEDDRAGFFQKNYSKAFYMYALPGFAIKKPLLDELYNKYNPDTKPELYAENKEQLIKTTEDEALNMLKKVGVNDLNVDLFEERSRSFALIRTYLSECLESYKQDKGDFSNALKESLKVVFRDIQSYHVMRHAAKVPVGANISGNNEATSCMAKLLNMKKGIVAKSQTTIINVDGRTIVANRMEEAKGGKLEDINAYNDKYRDYLSNNIGRILENYRTLEKSLAGKKGEERKAIKAKLQEQAKKFEEFKTKKAKTFKTSNVLLGIEGDVQKVDIKHYALRYEEVMQDSQKTMFKTTMKGSMKNQLIQLSILDYIMGQTDRKVDSGSPNILVRKKKIGGRVEITGYTAIDSDVSCGLLTPEEIKRRKFIGCLHSVDDEQGESLIPCIDEEFAKSILALTPEEVSFNLLDKLSVEQINAINVRLANVQRVIGKEYDLFKKGQQNKTRFISNEKGWEKFGKSESEAKSLTKFNKDMFPERLQPTFG